MADPLFELGRVFWFANTHAVGSSQQVVRWLDYYGRDAMLIQSRIKDGDRPVVGPSRNHRYHFNTSQYVEFHVSFGQDRYAKMVINRSQVSDLISHLQCWLDNGHFDFNSVEDKVESEFDSDPS